MFLEDDSAALGDIEVLMLQGLPPLAFQQHGNRGNLLITLNDDDEIIRAFLAAEAEGDGWLSAGNEVALFRYDARGFKESLESLPCR